VSQIEFLNPLAFLLLALPWVLRMLLPEKNQASQSLIFIPLAKGMFQQGDKDKELSNQAQPTSFSQYLSSLLFALAYLALIISAARPISLGEEIELEQTGRDIFLAVDISGSMREEDMPLNNKTVNRLVLVKHVLKDFILERQGDRLGLILFGSQAYIQAPLTFDLQTLSTLLNEAQIGFAGKQTAIGDAIGLGIKRLSEHPNDSKVMVLLTDGQNTAGSVDPLQAAQMAKNESVTIYTIGIGSDQVQSRGLFGMGSYNPSADLDVKTLNTIAKTTGGKFYRATNQADLLAIYAEIDAREVIDQDKQTFRPIQEWFYQPLLVSLSLLAFALVFKLISRRQRHV